MVTWPHGWAKHVAVLCFLLGDSPASDLYMPTFRNTLSVPPSKAGVKCSETSAYMNQTPGNHPKENKQHSEHGESLKSKIKNHSDMFRILCDTSSGSAELCLTEITRSDSQIFCCVLGRNLAS